MSNTTCNPINYLIVVNSTSVKNTENEEFFILDNYKKLFYDSYSLSPSFFSIIDQHNNRYLLLENKFYSMTDENGIYSFEFLFNLTSDFIFIDYIIDNKNKVLGGEMLYNTHPKISKTTNIIIYGKKDGKICFYYIDSNKLVYSNLTNIDSYISCKIVDKSIGCSYYKENRITLSLLEMLDENIITSGTYNNIPILNGYDNPILNNIDSFNEQYLKALCGRKKETGNIECFNVNLLGAMINEDIIISKININNIIYSFTEDNCNFTIFNSEYLICCGKIGIIICERRDMNLQFINLFNFTFPGKITNLTIHNYNDSFVKLLYNNKTSTDEHIYEYHIYPPKCKNENIILISYHSYTLNIDNLFEKKTNTNHYIILEQIPSYYGKIFVNGELIQQVGMKIKLNRKDNILYFISNNNLTVNNFEIKYNISIEETYSNLCTIFLTVKPCYPSCSNCSLSEEESNENSHNCIECAKGFFPFPENSSNCFNNNEMNDKNISYFFDPIKNAFSQCHSDCKTCNGSNENNCLSCRNETLFIYNGKCIVECPKKTSVNRKNEYQDCNINCETCLFPENSQLSSMNCLTCSEDKIIHS